MKNTLTTSNNSTIDDCKIIKLGKFSTAIGNITSVEKSEKIPFEVSRVFYLYDIPSGEDRGAHAHKECEQFLVAVSGAYKVIVNDGINQTVFSLTQPSYGLYIPAGIWASEIDFSSGSVALVLASHPYEEEDYLRDFNNFLEWKN